MEITTSNIRETHISIAAWHAYVFPVAAPNHEFSGKYTAPTLINYSNIPRHITEQQLSTPRKGIEVEDNERNIRGLNSYSATSDHVNRRWKTRKFPISE
jgi:hypothetical protein